MLISLATLQAKALGDAKLVAFRGRETLGRPYRFDLYFTTRQAVPLGGAVGTRATLRLARQLHDPFSFSGILASAQLLVQTQEWALHHAVLVPKLWQLGLTRHSRAYTKLTVPQLLRKVLEAAGLTSQDFELRLGAGYATEELIVQYRESELDFVHRWMEHEGISYFFEQGEDREKLVVVDKSSGFERLGKRRMRYHPLAGDDRSHDECIDAFNVLHSHTVSAVHVADYDYSRPMLQVGASHPVAQSGYGVQHDHSGRFFDPAHARRYAEIRADELRAREVLYHFAGNPLFVSAGYFVEIDDHPSEAFNQKKYLVVETHHFGNQTGDDAQSMLAKWIKPEYPEVYRVEATAVDGEVQYRPPRTTPWPRVWGYENGVVDGPHDSPYAQIDEHGRYLVKFQFDESELAGGKASTWVRMMQPHGGSPEGFHFPLRKGTEVVFNFLGGDPDRPVIVGVVPNALTPSKVTEANYTQNVIQTGAENFIKLEDKAGSEFIWAWTPNNDTALYMGSPWGGGGAGAGASLLAMTAGNGAFVISGSQVVDVGANVTETVGGSVTQTVGSFVSETYKSTHTVQVASTVSETYGADQLTEVAGSRNITIKGDENRHVLGSWNLTADVKATITTPTWLNTVSGLTSVDTGTMKQTSGDTTLTYGATHIDWGATDATIASLNLSIPGTATIHAPHWQVVDSHHHVIASEEEHGVALLKKSIGTLLEVKGFTNSITGAEINLHGVLIANKGITVEHEGVKTGSKGLKAWAQGLHLNLAGLHSLA